ncbi:MAG TPA: hypothetical protein VHB25_00080 [Gemmatimonadaceae bacterium]|nr:hypothetical protein [Gemmatimonadaceae bacterium]
MLSRRGATLAELVIALVVAGVVLGIVASISVREQRVFGDLANDAGLAGQLREAAAILPTDLRVVSPSAGDMVAGEARDTALQVRGSIASAVVCDTAAGAFVLPPQTSDASSFASGVSAVLPGDTAWVLAVDGAEWVPYRVSSVASTAPGQCGAGGPVLDAVARARPRATVVLAPAPPGETIGLPVRFTRPLRYSLYHASDGAWYLGERDWNPATQRFNTIQPVAGPLSSPARGGIRFEYFDSLGRALSVPLADASALAMIRIVLHGETREVVRALAAPHDVGAPAMDSTSVAVLLHNRR